MATRNTGTVLKDREGNNRTATALSTNILVKVDGNKVGAIKELRVSEKREVEMIDELGTDGHIDSAPKRSANVSGSCSRTRFERLRITEAFSRGFIHIKSQRIPFDIEIQDRFHDANPSNAIITTIQNVWMTSLEQRYSADDWIIVDEMGWEAEDIYSILNNKNVATSVANGRGTPIVLNRYEREADRGVYRGAIDAAGLLDAYLADPRDT